MRIGIVLRLIGILVVAGIVAVEAESVKNNAWDGKTEHYTVVLSADTNANAQAKADAKHGIKVDKVISNSNSQAYEALMTADMATAVQNESGVQYLEMDSQKVVRHTWWDTTLITLGINNKLAN